MEQEQSTHCRLAAVSVAGKQSKQYIRLQVIDSGLPHETVAWWVKVMGYEFDDNSN